MYTVRAHTPRRTALTCGLRAALQHARPPPQKPPPSPNRPADAHPPPGPRCTHHPPSTRDPARTRPPRGPFHHLASASVHARTTRINTWPNTVFTFASLRSRCDGQSPPPAPLATRPHETTTTRDPALTPQNAKDSAASTRRPTGRSFMSRCSSSTAPYCTRSCQSLIVIRTCPLCAPSIQPPRLGPRLSAPSRVVDPALHRAHCPPPSPARAPSFSRIIHAIGHRRVQILAAAAPVAAVAARRA